MRDRDADPASFNELLEGFVRRRGWSHRLELAKLRSAWSELCGPALGDRSQPTFLDKDGLLSVRCDEGVIASELRMMSKLIIERCNHRLGNERVKNLKTSVGELRGTPTEGPSD
jgi:predicted nucleic acid-binding Zn ribbon protein